MPNRKNDCDQQLIDAVPKKSDWTYAECYFAVWAYDQLDLDRKINKAALFRQISEVLQRTAKAVEYKVQNVAHFAPGPRHEKPIAEAANAQKMLEEVLTWYWKNRAAARAEYPSFAQRLGFEIPETAQTVFDPLPSLMIEEGAPTYVEHLQRTRSRRLLELGRDHFRRKDKDHQLRCFACDFVKPLSVPTEIVQLHHTEPLSDAGEHGWQLSLREAVKKLLPLCPTCHVLAHVERPPMPLPRIKQFRD